MSPTPWALSRAAHRNFLGRRDGYGAPSEDSNLSRESCAWSHAGEPLLCRVPSRARSQGRHLHAQTLRQGKDDALGSPGRRAKTGRAIGMSSGGGGDWLDRYWEEKRWQFDGRRERTRRVESALNGASRSELVCGAAKAEPSRYRLARITMRWRDPSTFKAKEWKPASAVLCARLGTPRTTRAHHGRNPLSAQTSAARRRPETCASFLVQSHLSSGGLHKIQALTSTRCQLGPRWPALPFHPHIQHSARRLRGNEKWEAIFRQLIGRMLPSNYWDYCPRVVRWLFG